MSLHQWRRGIMRPARYAGAVMIALVGACGVDQPTEPVDGGVAVFKRGQGSAKVDVCHSTGNGAYVKVRIAPSALLAHLAHGDEIAGGDMLDAVCEPVPGGEMTVDLPGGATMDFVWVEPDKFTMGSPDSRWSFERPLHEVTLSRGVWMGQYEVTQGQWASVMGTRPWVDRSYVKEGESYPAVYISWYDAQELVDRLNEAAGADVYRLPTEAEWEYACRAGTTTRWSFGDDEAALADHAWYYDNGWGAGLRFARLVGTKLANPSGLYDMHGNVFEWVQDWFGPYPSTPQVDPQGPETGSKRVRRGGHFGNFARATTSAHRGYDLPTVRYSDIGVRLVRAE